MNKLELECLVSYLTYKLDKSYSLGDEEEIISPERLFEYIKFLKEL